MSDVTTGHLRTSEQRAAAPDDVAAEQSGATVDDSAAERRTMPVELLWDLVFVFAVTQGHHPLRASPQLAAAR